MLIFKCIQYLYILFYMILDKAVQDRMDQIVCFDLPLKKERTDLLFLYFTKYCDPNYRLKDYLKDIWQ